MLYPDVPHWAIARLKLANDATHLQQQTRRSTMTNAAPQPSTLSTEDFSLAFREIDLTQYHEAGHAVAFYMLGFLPKRITGALAAHDRRSTSFFRTRPGQLTTPLARERAQDYAVTVIAGIAAESKFAGVPIAELRQVPGREDYLTVHSILDQLMLCHGCEFGPEVRAARLLLFGGTGSRDNEPAPRLVRRGIRG
jgi:hypothetical protein